jgi:hypothetical protein
MPKRVLDFDAMWASDKLAACAEWAQVEYAWFYGLADCNGCFELTNLRVIWGRVAAIRKNLSLERVEQVFNEFHDKGLLFRWSDGGKRYGHWTGSDVPGRLPPPSWRNRLERLAPPVPRAALEEYVAAFRRTETRNSSCHPESAAADEGSVSTSAQLATMAGSALPFSGSFVARNAPQDDNSLFLAARDEKPDHFVLKPSLEEAQAQDLDLDLVGKRDWETHTPCLELGVEESVRAVGENSPPEKTKSVCEVVSKLFREETKKSKVPVEEKKTKPTAVEEIPKSAGEGERRNNQSRSFVAKSAPLDDKGFGSGAPLDDKGFGSGAPLDDKGFGSGAPLDDKGFGSGAPLDDNGFGSGAPLDGNETVYASTVGARENASPVALKVESAQSTPEFRGNCGCEMTSGESAAQPELKPCLPAGRGWGTSLPDVDHFTDNGTPLIAINRAEDNFDPPNRLRESSPLRVGAGYAALEIAAEQLAEIWESERGSLPEMRAMTPERVARCRERLRNAGSPKFLEDFCEAVRRAAATPFLCGAGPAGWRANFDWMIANDTNYLKVLEGRYDSGNGSRDESVRRELRVGIGPSIDHAALYEVRSAEGASREVGSAEDHSPGPVVVRPAMRADVVERFRRRGQANAAQRQAQS